MIDGTSPAVELVCRCLAPAPDAAGRDRIEALIDGAPDWDAVTEFAGEHGVVPLVHRRLVGEYGDAVPDAVRERLDDAQSAQTARNLQMTSRLHDVLERFEAAGVRALPVKGPVLAAVAHGDLSRRTFNDLDLLVPKADVTRALDALESMGFERTIDVPRLDDAAVLGGPLTPPLVDEVELTDPATDTRVEVRWRIGTDPVSWPLAVETLWERRDSVTVAGRTVPALAPDDRLLLLTYHGVKHGWSLLKWLSDVAETVATTPDLDYAALYDRAGEHGIGRRLTVGLGLAAEVLDADVPGIEARLVADETAAALVERVCDRFRASPPAAPTPGETLEYHLAASESLPVRVLTWLFATRLQPSLAEYRLLPLPGVLHPLYYLLRPFRLLALYGRGQRSPVGAT
jgi:hypothetical protein